jgi:hypothetical protein
MVPLAVTVTWIDSTGQQYTDGANMVVQFNIIAPVKTVVSTDFPTVTVVLPGNPYGHRTHYTLMLLDNNGNGYANCAISENFPGPTTYAAAYQSNLIAQKAPGTPEGGTSDASGYFYDDNNWSTTGWTNPPQNTDTGNATVWFTFWQYMDAEEPVVNGTLPTTVGSWFISQHQGYATRTQ